jgi:nucleoside-diphosphate-sugar epimerase
MDLQLTDSVALVAGSSRGIGRAIAAALLAEGARVLVTGRSAGDVATAVSELGGGRQAARVRGFAGDLTQSAAVAGALEDVAAHWGRLDAVVANIGQGGWPGEWDAPDDIWREAFALNLFGSLALARAAAPRLRASRGSLIFIASIAGCETIGAPPADEAAKRRCSMRPRPCPGNSGRSVCASMPSRRGMSIFPGVSGSGNGGRTRKRWRNTFAAKSRSGALARRKKLRPPSRFSPRPWRRSSPEQRW